MFSYKSIAECYNKILCRNVLLACLPSDSMSNLKIKSQLIGAVGGFAGVQSDSWPGNLRRLDWSSAHIDSFADSSSPGASVSPFFRQGCRTACSLKPPSH